MLQAGRFQGLMDLPPFPESPGSGDHAVGNPGGKISLFQPSVIEPASGDELAAIVIPEFLFRTGLHWLAPVDQGDFPGDLNAVAKMLGYLCYDLVSQSAPHRTDVKKIGKLHRKEDRKTIENLRFEMTNVKGRQGRKPP